MMYVPINTAWDFEEHFNAMGRGDQFSRQAMEALFEYYSDMEDFQLDVVAICCDWTEFDSEQDALDNYGFEEIGELEEQTITFELPNGHWLVLNF